MRTIVLMLMVLGVGLLPDPALADEPEEVPSGSLTEAERKERLRRWRIEEELREREERRQAEKGLSFAQLRFVGGSVWLPDGVLNPQSTDATIMNGFAFRVGSNKTSRLAWELEALGATTNYSYFVNITVNGLRGTLARRANLGRLMLGGRMYLMDLANWYMPHVRISAGGQGVRYEEIFTRLNGVRAEDSSFEIEGLMSLGGGVDIRVGSKFRAGVTVSAFTTFAARWYSVEAGAHLGYFWWP